MNQQPELFKPVISQPSPLTVARNALSAADIELAEAEQLLEDQGPEAQPLYDKRYFAQARAARIVAKLEAEEIAANKIPIDAP